MTFEDLRRLIDTDVEELKRLRRLSVSISSADPSKEFVSGGPRIQCKFSYIVEQIIDLENKIKEEIREYIAETTRIREAINQVENPTYKAFLKYRYLENMTYNQIAEKMGYSERQIYNIRKDCAKLHLLFE